MGLVYSEKTFAQIEEDIKPLLELHWKELANYQDVRPLDPDYDLYRKLSEDGYLKLFTVIDGGVLVGYASFFVANHLHYKTWKSASCDVYWLHPEYRKKFSIGSTMFQEIEKWLKDMGVNQIVVQDKIDHSHAKFFDRLGFKMTEQNYEKVI